MARDEGPDRTHYSLMLQVFHTEVIPAEKVNNTTRRTEGYPDVRRKQYRVATLNLNAPTLEKLLHRAGAHLELIQDEDTDGKD